MTDLDPQAIAQMGDAVATMSDEDVHAFAAAQEGGPDALLRQVFEGMAAAFDAEKAGATEAVVQWDIETSEGPSSWTLRIAGGTAEASQGAAESPRVTLKTGLPDFLRIVLGRLDGIQAFMSGRLQLVGDIFFAQTFQQYFRRPGEEA